MFHNENQIVNSTRMNNNNNVFFLKKEFVYTKLKYSRVPQADIVSGGVAAFLSAFLGYLISEKFGFELIDSGDLYFFLIFIVFLVSSLKFWLKVLDNQLVSLFIKPVSNFLLIMVGLAKMVKNKIL